MSYTYSPRGRMATSTVGGTVTTYRYNGLGQRVWQKSSGEAANPAGIYVYDEAGKLLGEYDTATGKPAREIIYHQGIPVAVLSYRVIGTVPNLVWSTEVGYVFTDHLNTPRVIARASDNKVVWRWDDADPFGVAPPNENPSGLGTFTFNMRMPGQYYDRATNLFCNYFRNYDPRTGRYVQSDPIGLGGGINTYGYVAGNPVSYVDPRGLQIGVPVIPPPPIAPARTPGADPYDPKLTSPGPKISDLLKPSPYLPTWDWPDWVYGAVGKPPKDALDPNGSKAPGKPGGAEGFCEPKRGKPQWGKNPNGSGSGWVDADGNVWVPTGPDSGSTGDAHGGPHWDVQRPGGGYENIYPGGKKR